MDLASNIISAISSSESSKSQSPLSGADEGWQTLGKLVNSFDRGVPVNLEQVHETGGGLKTPRVPNLSKAYSVALQSLTTARAANTQYIIAHNVSISVIR